MTTKQHLTHLESTGLLRLAQTHPELEYLFRHALVQDAAYESLLLADRKELHRQIGETLERLYPDRLNELASLLGQHFAKAGEVEKAIHYLLQAGDRARDLYAHQEAIDHYQQALIFLKEQGDFDRAARTQMKVGLTHHSAFDYWQARQAYEASFALRQQAENVEPEILPPAPHALRIAWDNPVKLDSTRVADIISSGVIHQLFSGLAEVGLEMDIVPNMVQSWEILDEGQKYIFHLRDNMHWSDGVPVTAADFEFTWKRLLDPTGGTSFASLLYDVKGARAFHQGEMTDPDSIGVQALDTMTLVVYMEKPTYSFLYHMSYNSVNPVPRHTVVRYGDAWATVENIVTNGPFRLESWRPDEAIILTRNPTYYGRFTGNVDRVELITDGDFSARLKLYETGGLDSLMLPQTSEVERIRQRFPGEYFSSPSLTTRHLSLVVSHPPFDDPRVRRAFGLAIDRETYANEVAKGIVAPATGGFLPPGMPGHLAGIGLPYDPDRARQLLAEAGYPAGQNFPAVEWLIEPGQESLAAYLRDQWWENLDLKLSWEAPERSEFHYRLENQPPSLYLVKWSAPHPDFNYFTRIFVEVERSSNPWQNETYDKLTEEAQRVIDQATRLKLYRQADKILVEEAPFIPLVYESNHFLVKPWVKKFPLIANAILYCKDVVIEPH